MDLNLPDELSELLRTVRRFAAERVAPEAAAFGERGQIPPAIFRELGELGLLGLLVPASQGGAELEPLALVVLVETLARADAGLALAVASHNLAALAVPQPSLLSGEKRAALALEPAGDAPVIAPWAELLVVLDGSGGCVVLEPRAQPAAQAALGVRSAGLRAYPTEGGRKQAAPRGLETLATLAYAALALGVGEAALLAGRDYSKDRRQFGKPIADFQATQWKLADGRTQLDAAQCLLFAAAAAQPPAPAAAAKAKLLAAEAAVRAADDALQLHGGYGYTEDFPIERYYRDAGFAASVTPDVRDARLIVAADVFKSA